tara:strand:+ start:145 stop:714 length:570 start_codon:yes stop_codon:yes gene_type:complete
MKYNPRYHKKNYFDGVPEDRTAVDNIFRLGVTNQMRLNINADRKAGQMITVSAIVFSVTAANFDNPLLMYPLMFFAVCCILTLLFAIIAIIPNNKYPKNYLGKLDQKSEEFDPLYFGHFSYMTKEEYKAYYALTIMNDDRIYDALAGEMYYSGKALALVKYKWLRLSYGTFLFGMIGSIIITVYSLIAT